MSLIDNIASKFPSVAEPKAHISFKVRLKWTGAILLLYLVMTQIILYGVSPTTKQQFQFFELILGSSIGSLLTLGIGPIVTASIILQLLVGSGLIPWNLRTMDGKRKFQNAQKLTVVFFSFFEAYAYVAFGAVQPVRQEIPLMIFLVLQLAMGGIIVLLMDEVVSKWGIGSGVSLFIAAGVTKQIFVRAFNPLTPEGATVPAGLVPQFIAYLSLGDLFQAFTALIPVLATIIVFLVVVYIQAIKVEIPLALGSVRGFARRWPLNLLYTSNIPVILVGALLANLQLVGRLVARPVAVGGQLCGPLGCFDAQGQAINGLVLYFFVPRTLSVEIFFIIFLATILLIALLAFYLKMANLKIIIGTVAGAFLLSMLLTNSLTGLPTGEEVLRIIVYFFILTLGSMIFSVFWVTTSGMDARSVAEQIEGMGMQIPGFRRDPRIVEEVLNRYIPTLTLISGLAIGCLAALADFTGALGTGTGILLTVMIVYNLYENIAARYVEDMHPALRKFFG